MNENTIKVSGFIELTYDYNRKLCLSVGEITQIYQEKHDQKCYIGTKGQHNIRIDMSYEEVMQLLQEAQCNE